jgi:hypothetical protein
MNIGMVTRWNVPCGVGVHGELMGRAWVKMGHQLKVFAPVEREDPYIAPDEPYVVRCYSKYGQGQEFIYEEPFLEEDFDVFVVQTMMMSGEQLGKVFPKIREKAKTVFVIHDEWLDRNLLELEPDAVVCFDERYRRFLAGVIPEEKIHIIPYPCHEVKHGDKTKARRKLNLLLDRKIIFNFGIGVFRHIHLLPPLERLSHRYPLMLLTVTWVKDWFELFDALKSRYSFIEVRQEALSTELLYSYLHASDALLIHKDPATGVAVASGVYQCLGSGCPIVVHNVNFFETLGDEVLKYSGFEDLVQKLESIFRKGKEVKHTLEAAQDYAQANSGEEIARRFLYLFQSLS